MARILVTGGSGHLGANLVRRLLDDGETVRVLVPPERENGAFQGIAVERVKGDLRDREAVASAVRGCTQVFHCAAMVSTFEGNAAHRQALYDTNVLGTRHILRAAARHGVEKVVVTGSLGAVGTRSGAPCDESTPFDPFNRPLPYAVSKHLAEHECLQAHADGINVVIASASAVVGPHDFMPSRLGRAMIDYAQRRLPAYIPGGFAFVSGADIAEGHVLAMRKGRSGQKYLFSTAFMSVDDLMSTFGRLTGQPPPRLRLPARLMELVAEAADRSVFRIRPNMPRQLTPSVVRLLRSRCTVDCGKAQRELGYRPTSLAAAFQAAYDDFVRRGLILPAA